MPSITNCPECGFIDVPDTVAIHLIDTHRWETDKATVWLREQAESDAFDEAV